MRKRALWARYSFQTGALGRTRTDTGRILSPLSLPLDYKGGQNAEQSTRRKELDKPCPKSHLADGIEVSSTYFWS